MASLLAPPYDVIDATQAALLRNRSPFNCVHVILPEGDADEKYRRAAVLLDTWKRDGHLVRDAAPAAYVYRQRFVDDRGAVERYALFCALRISPFAESEVLPHERTHPGPRKDRLALTVATRTQLSPVFMIARDGEGELYRALSGVIHGRPPAFETRTPDGDAHALWVEGDPGSAASLCATAGAHPLLIADGHHRYETALRAAQVLGECVKARYLMVCIVSQRDPGLVVQPTHRVLAIPPGGSGVAFAWREALEERFEVRDVEGGPARRLEQTARAAGGTALVAVPGGRSDRGWLLTPSVPPPDASRLAPVSFDSLVLRHMYGMEADAAARAGLLSYVRDPAEAIRVTPGAGCAFLLPPVSLDDVWAIAAERGRLPPKSTYFEPKVPSGLLFRSLA